jgi:hypothetical protein
MSDGAISKAFAASQRNLLIGQVEFTWLNSL